MKSNATTHWLALVSLALVWGSSFILIKKGVEGFTALQMGTLRIGISMLFLLPVALYYFSRVPRNRIGHLVIAGFIGNLIPAILFATAETKVDSGLAGILNASTPLFAFLIGIAFFGMLFRWYRLGGVLLGLGGTILLVLYGSPHFSLENTRYAVLIIAATICYGTSVNFIKRYLQEIHPLAISGVSLFFVGVLSWAYLFSTDFTARIAESALSRESLGYIAILALFSTSLASILFFWLTQKTDALFASTVTYMIPVVAIGWGILAGESVSLIHFLGMILILSGVYLSSARGERIIQRLLRIFRH